MLGYMNDPLDEKLENCDWDVEGDRIYVKIKPGRKVSPGEELFIQYGEQYWCSIQYSFEVLQKALWRYRNKIDLKPTSHWPNHPSFHDLFNTPYNGELPFPNKPCPCARCRPCNSTSSASSNSSVYKRQVLNK